MNEKKKWTPIICVDFDGVLNSYSSGWKGAGNIPDPPVEGAMKWLASAVDSGKVQIAIYSSRSKESIGIYAMRVWLAKHLTSFFEHQLEETQENFMKTWPGLRGFMIDHPNGDKLDIAMQLAGLTLEEITFPTEKPAAIMTIDDRAHCFMGKFRPIEWYLNFKPWNKRSPEENVPDYHPKDWDQNDEDLADEALEVLLDCLVTDRDGFTTFEPSAQEYMASMFMEARKTVEGSQENLKKWLGIEIAKAKADKNYHYVMPSAETIRNTMSRVRLDMQIGLLCRVVTLQEVLEKIESENSEQDTKVVLKHARKKGSH